ncbi:MAG: hypothetical protein FWD11_10025, partial [Micrococcales bacterium]|nr:hypothetical protein [Micrococcales bacterium]
DIGSTDREVVLVTTGARGVEAARATRLALGNTHLGLLPLTAPPTLVYVFAAVAAMVPDFAMGYLPNVFARTSHYTRTFAALSSVRGMTRPEPSRATLRRWGGGPYVVDWQTQSVEPGKEITLPQHAWAVSSSSDRPPTVTKNGWPPRAVELDEDGSFWGSQHWLEVTAVSQPPQAIIGSLFASIPPDAVQCRSCARVCGGDICVFCQVRHFDSTPHDPSEIAMNGAG